MTEHIGLLRMAAKFAPQGLDEYIAAGNTEFLLQRDRTNKYDMWAMRVTLPDGTVVGFLGKPTNIAVARFFDRKTEVDDLYRVTLLAPGPDGRREHGLLIELTDGG